MGTIDSLLTRVQGREIRKYNMVLPLYNISKANQSTIFEYHERLLAQGRKEPTRRHYVRALADLAQITKKDFRKMEEKDIIKYVNWLMKQKRRDGNPTSPGTRNTYKQCLFSFFRWLKGIKNPKAVPEMLGFITFEEERTRAAREEHLTTEEILKMIEVADNPRDKFIIAAMGFDIPCRRGEFVSCQLKHLTWYPTYVEITFPAVSKVSRTGVAKTGTYKGYLTESVIYLKQYLETIHPDPKNPEAPLLVGIGQRDRGAALETDGLYLMLKRVGKLAGIKRRVYCHLFRHSLSTVMAVKGISAEKINLLSGRSQGSKEAQKYIKLVNKDARDAMLEMKGIKKPEPVDVHRHNGNIKCPYCDTPNPFDNLFCMKKDCRMPLRTVPGQENIVKAIKMGRTINELDNFPEEKAKLARTLVEIASSIRNRK